MIEFTIDIETIEGASTSEKTLDRVAEELGASTAADPSVSINTETGVVAATFQVQAETIPAAADLAVDLYTAALVAAGVSDPGGTMEVSEVGSLTVAQTRDHALAGV